MSENEVFLWLGYMTLFCSMILLWYIPRKRNETFSNFSERELAVKEQFNNIIYMLALICVCGFLLNEIVLLASGVEESISGMFYFQAVEKALPYIFLCLTVLCFAIFAAYKEFLIIQRMKDARRKLLLGELPVEGVVADSVEVSSTMPLKSRTVSEEPATFAAVLQAMDLQLKQAVQAAEDLKSELHETKQKVETLELEVQQKDSEINQIKESRNHFDKMMTASSESKDGSEIKSLSVADSALVGDTIMGGVKIDKQINNDPEAIARAVIEAYRMGKIDN